MEVAKSSQRCNCLLNDVSMLGPHHKRYCNFWTPVSAMRADFNGGCVMLLKAVNRPERHHDGVILQEVIMERQYQDDKYGAGRSQTILEWWAILSEEYGEAAHDVVDGHWTPEHTTPAVRGREYYRQHLRHELIQTAASAVAMVDAIDRGAPI